MSNFTTIDKEYKFYKDNFDKLLAKYSNKFIVISNCQVQGSFNNVTDAMTFALENFQSGNFIVESCTRKGIEPQVFHSRVFRVS